MKDELRDLAADLVGPGLDAVVGSKVAEAIPGLGSALKLAVATAAIPNLLFAKKVEGFIGGMDSVSPKRREEMYSVLSGSPQKARLAGEIIIQAIDRADSRKKAAIIGRLFTHYILGDVDLDCLQRLLFAVDRAFLLDLLKLPNWSISGNLPDDFDPQLLESTGLINTNVVVTASGGRPTHGCSALGRRYGALLLGFDPA